MSHYIALVCSIICIGISIQFFHHHQQFKKRYQFQIGLLIAFNGINLFFRFICQYMNYRVDWMVIVYNWSQFITLVLYAALQCDLLKLWNRIASPVVIGLTQMVCLVQGLYMTFLIKAICVIKDYKSKMNFEKYLKYSYILLSIYNSLIILAVISYAIGIIIRGPETTPNFYVFHGLVAVAAICVSIQIIALGYLFEAIICMKFGTEIERRKAAMKDTTK
ncbi:hypothetical protein BC833DRAFT_569849 [Globomyces pollinis-pini]|nr:hypothetical protein BC833DRAFT_569849 [Globomyces pollinis-pini]